MGRLDSADRQNDFYLQMGRFTKSFTDKDGNFIFDVEASNENLDLEGERTLQQAILSTKDYFLTNGVISKDHLHQEFIPKEKGGGIKYHEEYVIGEPLEVYKDGNSTRVRGKLYKSNRYAMEFAKLLADKSTRVKASVGGLLPQKIENKDGTKTVVSVIWNDLALTVAPINPTVGPAVISKSMTSAEFVKSLSAGYGTDAAQFTGGRALQAESVGRETVSVSNEEAIASLIGAMAEGAIQGFEDAEKFLNDYGFSKETTREIIREVVKHNNQFLEVLPMKKSSAWESITENLRKALGKKPEDETDSNEPKKEDGDGDSNNSDNDDVVDASPILKSLAEHIEKLEETTEIMAKALTSLTEQSACNVSMQKSIGESLLAVMERTEQIAASPAPRKGAVSALEAAMAMSKAGLGGMIQQPSGGVTNGKVRLNGFTVADFDEAKDILSKARGEGKLTLLEVTRAESQLNKAIGNPAALIDQKFADILRNKAQ